MVNRPRSTSLIRRSLVFLLAYAAAWTLSGYLLPDHGAAHAQKAAKKGSKKAKAVEVDPCANFEFEMLPVNEEAGKGAARDSLISSLRSGALTPGSEASFDAFFASYQLPRLTQCKEIYSQGGIQRVVKDLRSYFKYEGITRGGPVRERLNAIVLRDGQKVAQGNYHPAARYNAMLLIAELNTDEGDEAAKGQATPLPAALPVLVATVSDGKQIEAVKAAALIGIDRHVRAGAVGNSGPQITAAMVALVNQKTPPSGTSSEGHDWLRGQAASVLGALRSVGAKNEVVTALEGVVADTNAAQSLRARAARALGNLDYSKAQQVDPSKVAAQVAAMVVTFYNQEKKQADRMEQLPNRRLLKSSFLAAYSGLTGAGGADNKQNLLALAKNAGDPHAKFVTELANEVQTVASHEIFDTEYVEPAKLATGFAQVTANVKSLENYLKTNLPKAKAAAPAQPAADAGKAAAPAGKAAPGPGTPAGSPPAAAAPAAAAPAAGKQ
jgi:hypothetical protein